MLDLPYATHRSLIEPLTGEKHVKKILLSRFLGFMEKIEKSGKKALRMLKDTSMKDVRSVTGSNYRSIMLLVGKSFVSEVTKADADRVEYFPIGDNEKWKVGSIQEIINIKNGLMEVPGFELEELDEVLDYLCTS